MTPPALLEAAPPPPVAEQPSPLRTLLGDQVSDLYAAEKDTVQVLSELALAARSPRLAHLFRMHVAETNGQIRRLRGVLDDLGIEPRPLATRGKRGLLEDCLRLAEDDRGAPAVRDAGLMAVAQHLGHDAIASYECVCHWAGLLGLTEAAGLLALNMAEERRADGRLRRLSESLDAAMLGPAANGAKSAP
jgi:ferritin-like metal-binding protein YciE